MLITLVDVDNIQSTDFKIHRENGCRDYLFVLFKSPAKVLVCHEYVDADWGSFIIFDKHKIQSYHPCNNKEFIHDFMHFDLENDYERNVFSEIPKGKLLHIPLPHTISNILSEIKSELNGTHKKHKDAIMTHLGMAFLYRIKNEIENAGISNKKSDYFAEFYRLRLDLYDNPQMDWSIETMCRQVCLSRSYFQCLYKSFFFVSCTEDVINARVAQAKVLLVSSNLKIYEIANKCGYSNAEHFIRQFKKKTGTSPEKFRNR